MTRRYRVRPQGKLGGCTVISCDVTLNYTTYYLSLGTTCLEASAGPWRLSTLDESVQNTNWNDKWRGERVYFFPSYEILLRLCESWNNAGRSLKFRVKTASENVTRITIISLARLPIQFAWYSRFLTSALKRHQKKFNHPDGCSCICQVDAYL